MQGTQFKLEQIPIQTMQVLKGQSQNRELSPAAQDFAASRGTDVVHSTDLVDDALEVFQARASPLATIIPAPPLVSTQVNSVDSHLHPYHGSSLSLYSRINLATISSIDLNLDMLLPPYLSLNTAVDILKLIQDDTCSLQGVDKDVPLKCFETLDEVETPGAVVPVQAAPQEEKGIEEH
jgi:hypothetical protein